jgi:iron complex outermembrane receptor protein
MFIVARLSTLLLAASAAAEPPASSTPVTAALIGRVVSTEGAPLRDARVVVPEAHRSTTTNDEGRYRIADLPSGSYPVSFALIGYQPAVRRVTIGAVDVTLDVTLTPAVLELAPLQVTASPVATTALASPQPVSVLSGDELQVSPRSSLGAQLEGQPGLRNLSTGVGIGKPVIRGLTSNRVLVLVNGQRLENAQWGDEHGPNLETADVDRIEIIRGPASVLYGSDALGGVINVIPPLLPDAGGGPARFRARMSTAYGTNNQALDGVLTLEGASGPVGFRVSASGRTSDDVKTPEGLLANSGNRAVAGSLSLGSRGRWGSFTLEYAGRDERVEIHEDPAEEPDFTGFQRIGEHRFRGTLSLSAGSGSRLEILTGFERNRRREFEEAGATDVALGLLSRTLTGDLHLHHALGRLAGTVGLSALRTTFDKFGEETLIPASATNGLGVFFFEQAEAGRWNLSFGARFDHRRLTAEADDDLGITDQRRTWNSVTGNVGALYRATDRVALVLNLGRGFRAPSSFELFSNGVHEGTARFERGSATLEDETSLNGDLALRVQTGNLSAEIGGFVNRVENYIYPDPTGAFDPESGLQIFDYTQGDARLIGFEAAAQAHLSRVVHVKASADYVRGANLTTDQPLPFIPPLRLTYELRLEGADRGVIREPHVSLGGESNLRQTRLDPDDFGPPGYTLIHLGAGLGLATRAGEFHVDVDVRNLFDKAYAGFLSRYKLYALDQGRNLTVRVSTRW